MCRLRTDDEVDRMLGLEVEDVSGAEIYGNARWRRRAGNRLAHRIEIDPDQIDGAIPAAAPVMDPPQQVAVAVSDVEDRRALMGIQPTGGLVEPFQDRTMG